jgi:putative solute:sodium symporter small subunit
MQLLEKHRQYWAKNTQLTTVLLLIWFVTTFVMAWFARDLHAIKLFDWPLSFYIAAQGAPIIYVLLIGYYAHRMNQLDTQYGVQEAVLNRPRP